MDKRIVEEMDSIYTALRLQNKGKVHVRNLGEYMMGFEFNEGNVLIFYRGLNLHVRVAFREDRSKDFNEESTTYELKVGMLNYVKQYI